MSMLRVACALILVCGASQTCFAGETWTPEVKFSLEQGSYLDTLHWVSGFSYALTEVAKATKRDDLYCVPANGYIGSRDLLDILNSRFAGKVITSEIAAAAIMDEVRHRFPCK